MQLAPLTSVMAPMDVDSAYRSTDIVPPSKLFAVANAHFTHALSLLDVPEDATVVPDTTAATLAAGDAAAGIRMLRSVLVPGTAFPQRQAAVAALGWAQTGAELISRYAAEVAELGQGPLEVTDVPIATLRVLADARERLVAASARLSS